MATTSRSRPIRPLMLIVLIIVGLYSVVFLKSWTPRLGLDLRGGTSVTLTPRGTVSGGNLDKAVDIIRQRVNGSGVAESEVVRQGNNVLVAIPDVGRDEALKLVGDTAYLTFRHVNTSIQGLPSGGTASANPSASPSAGASVRPSGSKTPSTKPSASASAKPSTTTAPRPVPLALTQPSPAPTGSARPAPSATPASSPAATPTAAPPPADPFAAIDSLTGFGYDAKRNAELKARARELDCSEPDKVDPDPAKGDIDPLKPIIACDRDSGAKMVLDPAIVPNPKDPKKPETLTGLDVSGAQATVDQAGAWIVNINFKSAGSRKFGEVTKAYVNQQVAIALDNIVESAPNINEEITGGTATISGGTPPFSKKNANDLANVLKYGALPVVFEQSEVREISPTLGKDSLHGGLLAGFIGIGVVMLYALLYYRGLGLVTILGLVVFASINFALVIILGHLIGFTLTLAGIAGLIVSVGITADSYVVFFERLKDEVREGRTLRSSVDRGFARAWRTILAADFVSFLAAAALYLLSVGAVRGFAFTLGLSTILDVAIAWLFTKPLVTLLTRTRAFSEGRFVGIMPTVSTGPIKPAAKGA